jgi:hypothetical protein
MATYYVKVVRETGTSPFGMHLDYAEETLTIEADNRDKAAALSRLKSSIKFMGQMRRTYIKQEGEMSFEEYLDPNY